MPTNGKDHELPPDTSPRDAAILVARAEGRSIRETAQAVGCSPATVKRTTAGHREWLDEERRRLQRRIVAGMDEAVDARLADAADKESRTGAQSLRVLAESVLGWGGKGDVHVHGDVGISTVDARQINMIGLSDEQRAELQRLRELMGCG